MTEPLSPDPLPTDPATRPASRLALAGPLYAALTVAAAAAFPAPPGGDVAPGSRPGWLAAHGSAVIGQAYLRAVAAVCLAAFAVAVARRCRRAAAAGSPLPALALAGGVGSALLLLAGQAAALAAVLAQRGGAAPGGVRAIGALDGAFLDLSSLPAALLYAAVGLVALRTALLPRWLGVLTVVGVPVALLDAASYHGGPFDAVGLVGLLFGLGWALLAGGVLAVRRSAAPAEGPLLARAG